MTGLLVAFEGLDQSGKQTQAERLAAFVQARGRTACLLSFPNYETPIGREIHEALHGGRDYAPDVMQLLYIANRYEHRRQIEDSLSAGRIIICDRYLASSIAYGEAQGLDPQWLADAQRHLPTPTLTILLDIDPDTAVRRKTTNRDRYERDLTLLSNVRKSYQRQASGGGWLRLDGDRSKDVVGSDVIKAVESLLAPQ